MCIDAPFAECGSISPRHSPSSVPSRKEVGAAGESVACELYQTKGYQFVAKNWRCRVGELDLIFCDDERFLFVEVKSRIMAPRAEEYLFSTITPQKQQKLRQLVGVFFSATGLSRRGPDYEIEALGIIFDAELKSVLYLEQRKL